MDGCFATVFGVIRLFFKQQHNVYKQTALHGLILVRLKNMSQKKAAQLNSHVTPVAVIASVAVPAVKRKEQAKEALYITRI